MKPYFSFSGMNAASFGDIHHRFAKSDVSPWIPCVQTGGSTSLAWGIEPSLSQTKEIYHPPEERTWHPFGIHLASPLQDEFVYMLHLGR